MDPLDGTKEFIKRNGEFTVNIALIREHAPVLGVVHVPARDTDYFAHRGAGAWLREPGRKAADPRSGGRPRIPCGSWAAGRTAALHWNIFCSASGPTKWCPWAAR